MKVTAIVLAILGAVLATGYAAALLALSTAVGAIGAESAGLAKLVAIVLPIPSIIGCFVLSRNPRAAAVFLGGSAALYVPAVGWIALPVVLPLGAAALMAAFVTDRAKERDQQAQVGE